MEAPTNGRTLDIIAALEGFPTDAERAFLHSCIDQLCRDAWVSTFLRNSESRPHALARNLSRFPRANRSTIEIKVVKDIDELRVHRHLPCALTTFLQQGMKEAYDKLFPPESTTQPSIFGYPQDAFLRREAFMVELRCYIPRVDLPISLDSFTRYVIQQSGG